MPNATISQPSCNILLLWLGITAAAWAADLIVDQRHAKASDDNPGSAEAPFKTIGKAVGLAKAGDTVLIKGGDYREAVSIKSSGTAEQPLVIKAAPGERVLINGSAPITGWKKCTAADVRGNPHADNVYCTELDWEPRDLYVNGRRQTVSRWPAGTASMHSHAVADGKTVGDATTIADPINLTQPAGFWEGGELYVYCVKTTNTDHAIIKGWNPETHELTIPIKLREPVTNGVDRFYVKNLASIIAKPGEFAYDIQAKPARLFLWPSASGDIATMDISGSKLGKGGSALLSWAPTSSYVIIDGLEMAYGQGTGIGGESSGAHHITVQNCLVHHNRSGARGGVFLVGQSDLVLRRNIVFRNENSGIGLIRCKKSLVSENEVFGNYVDGIGGGWFWEDMRFERNYVHDQWAGGHPDGFQTYNGPDRLVLDSNLFMNIGQGWQCENTTNVKLTNNAWVGTHHTGLSISNRITWSGSEVKDKRSGNEHFEWRNNTVAYLGFAGLINIVTDFKLENNVFSSGRADAVMLSAVSNTWTSDYNLLWTTAVNGGVYIWNGGDRLAGFAPYQKLSGQDAHSKEADPKFRNAPRNYRGGDTAKGGGKDGKNQNTTEKLFVARMTPGLYEVGDQVEINWDGVRRRVKEVAKDLVIIDPPLSTKPANSDFTIANWKDDKAPWPYRYWLDATKLTQSTTNKLVLRGPFAGQIVVNDQVEVDWDGVKRTVKEVGADYIVIDPPLAAAPTKSVIIGNIKDTQTPCFTRPIDAAKMSAAPLNRVHVTGPVADYFAIHDFVEIGDDGVRREIVQVGQDHLGFTPELASRATATVVKNWRDNRTFAVDIRLAPDSPGWKMGSDGRHVGSHLDIPAIMRGDFDSDGIRDLPEIPLGVPQDF